jgi:L-rhamnonate dehydratase
LKIRNIRAAPLKGPGKFGNPDTPKAAWFTDDASGKTGGETHYKAPWGQVVCVVTADDGSWGLGMTTQAGPVPSIINDHFAPLLEGQSCFATEKLWDVMFKASTHYGVQGLASHAISAVDLALWDLKGKLLNKPVYELLGGPARERIFCYATGHDIEWFMELGFKAVKLGRVRMPRGCPEALAKNEEMVAKTREQIGPDTELMLDCYAVESDQEFIVRLAERLRPYRLKWIEDYLAPEDLPSYQTVRRRLPWQGLASGERWHTPLPFLTAANQQLVDIFQPDLQYVGGITAAVKVCHIADAAGLQVMTHLGANDAYGQHFCFAMPNNTWGELFVETAPGAPLIDGFRPTPGMAVPKNGYIVPNDAPGFGIELTMKELESAIA